MVLFLTTCTEETQGLMDAFSLPTLARLAITCRAAYAAVQQYTAYRIKRHLGYFRLDYDRALGVLRRTESMIVGTFALACVDPPTGGIYVDNIDFIVPNDRVHEAMKSLTQGTDYEMCELQHLPIQGSGNIIGVVSYRAVYNGKKHFLNFHFGGPGNNEFMLENLFYSSTTLTMNVVTGWGIFITYGDLVEYGMGLQNDPTSMRRFHTPTLDESIADFDKDNARQTKLEQQGFKFPTRNGQTHTFHNSVGRCSDSHSCPDAIRSVRDMGCRFVVLMDNTEVRKAEEGWHLKNTLKFSTFQLPETIWRLSNSIEETPRKAAGTGFAATIQSREDVNMKRL